MAARRVFLISIAALTLIAACSKTQSSSSPTSDTTPKPDGVGPCAAPQVNALLAEITREENAKAALDTTAKSAPDRANFRKVYDAETAFVAATEDRAAKLVACGASAAVLADVKARLEKSRTNLTYLRESFPDFK
jgi:hypothetical protein